jgi:hypothetical protein
LHDITPRKQAPRDAVTQFLSERPRVSYARLVELRMAVMKPSGANNSEVPVAAGATPTPSGSDFANWTDRMQRARGRHSAITRNLYTWSSYKNWAERVKTDWDDGEGK